MIRSLRQAKFVDKKKCELWDSQIGLPKMMGVLAQLNDLSTESNAVSKTDQIRSNYLRNSST